MEQNGQLHTPATLPPRKNPRTLWIRGWVVQQPVRTLRRREKSRVSPGVQNPYHAACSTVTIPHSFTQNAQWTKTSNQHTLQSPVFIMYCTWCAVMPTALGGTWSFILLLLFVLWTISRTVYIFRSHLYYAKLYHNCHFIHVSENG